VIGLPAGRLNRLVGTVLPPGPELDADDTDDMHAPTDSEASKRPYPINLVSW
jgi:hypothetical protein